MHQPRGARAPGLHLCAVWGMGCADRGACRARGATSSARAGACAQGPARARRAGPHGAQSRVGRCAPDRVRGAFPPEPRLGRRERGAPSWHPQASRVRELRSPVCEPEPDDAPGHDAGNLRHGRWPPDGGRPGPRPTIRPGRHHLDDEFRCRDHARRRLRDRLFSISHGVLSRRQRLSQFRFRPRASS
jgi:hypothetical protein